MIERNKNGSFKLVIIRKFIELLKVFVEGFLLVKIIVLFEELELLMRRFGVLNFFFLF